MKLIGTEHYIKYKLSTHIPTLNHNHGIIGYNKNNIAYGPIWFKDNKWIDENGKEQIPPIEWEYNEKFW